MDTVEEVKINISTNITITEQANIDTIKATIESETQKYLLEIRKTWENDNNLIVRISQIESRILNVNNVLDIANTQINGGTSNVELLSNEIPILGNVEVNV